MKTGTSTNQVCNIHAVDCMEVTLQIRELKYILQNPCKKEQLAEYIEEVKQRFKRIDSAMENIIVGQTLYVIDTKRTNDKHPSFKPVVVTTISDKLSGSLFVKDETSIYPMNVLSGLFLQQTIESQL